MRNLISFGLALACFSLIAYAETCPTIQDIKHNKYAGWQIIDIDSEKTLSPIRTAYFIKNISKFVLAEWTHKNSIVNEKNSNNGSIHCYYHDKNGGSLDAYLVKNDYVFKNDNKYWYEVTGFMRCAAEQNKCLFQSIEDTKLAQK